MAVMPSVKTKNPADISNIAFQYTMTFAKKKKILSTRVLTNVKCKTWKRAKLTNDGNHVRKHVSLWQLVNSRLTSDNRITKLWHDVAIKTTDYYRIFFKVWAVYLYGTWYFTHTYYNKWFMCVLTCFDIG